MASESRAEQKRNDEPAGQRANEAKRGSEASGRANERMRMAEWPNERNERPPCRNETSGGRASEANGAGPRSRRKQTRQTTERAKRAAAGWGWAGKIPGGALAERLLEAELTPASDGFACAKGTNNDQIEDERARRGGRGRRGRWVGRRKGRRAHRQGTTPPGAGLSGGGGRSLFCVNRWHVAMM